MDNHESLVEGRRYFTTKMQRRRSEAGFLGTGRKGRKRGAVRTNTDENPAAPAEFAMPVAPGARAASGVLAPPTAFVTAQ